MWVKLKQAAEEGVLLGVKYGLAVALVILAVSLLIGDYNVVRQQAQKGQQAFTYLQQREQAAQQPPVFREPEPEPAPPDPP